MAGAMTAERATTAHSEEVGGCVGRVALVVVGCGEEAAED